jgi:hypothetical protein
VSDSVAPDDSPPRVLAEISHDQGYAGLVAAFRARSNELEIAVTGEAVAEVAGIPASYFAKILSPSANPRKRFGALSLGPIMAVLGLKIVLIEDRAAVEQYTRRIPRRNGAFVHHNSAAAAINISLSKQFLRKIGRLGAEVKWSRVRKRRAQASKAARARWNGHKANGHRGI